MSIILKRFNALRACAGMLGYRVGDEFEWSVPLGKRRMKVEEILYQPEAAGDFHR